MESLSLRNATTKKAETKKTKHFKVSRKKAGRGAKSHAHSSGAMHASHRPRPGVFIRLKCYLPLARTKTCT